MPWQSFPWQGPPASNHPLAKIKYHRTISSGQSANGRIQHAVLTGKANVLHTTPLPSGVTRAAGVAMLHDLEFFLRCDPHMADFQEVPVMPASEAGAVPVESAPADKAEDTTTKGSSPPAPVPAPAIPEHITPLAGTSPKVYRVVDVVHALPAGIWDSKVESVYEFTATSAGVFVRIRSPLNVVMETLWEIRDAKPENAPAEGTTTAGTTDANGLVIAEDVEISCSRLLISVVKSQCEANWKGIHGKMVARLEQEANSGAGA